MEYAIQRKQSYKNNTLSQRETPMKLLLTCLCFIIFTPFIYASEAPYPLPITRDGKTHNMIAYNFWSGEYPEPVIYVQPVPSIWRTIMGYASLRDPKNKKQCTIQSGLYHPWSYTENSLINRYSILPKVNYYAQKNMLIDDLWIKKGSRLKHEVYLSEGYCTYRLNGKKTIDLPCIEASQDFRRIQYPAHLSEQWLYLRCDEGYNVFVQDKDLLRQPNVSKGKIVGYGEIRP
jgi:hypothetical protein